MEKLIIFLLFLLVSIMWGTTWIAMKIVISTIPPIFATGLRFLITSPLLIFSAWCTNTPLLFPAGQRLTQIFISIFYFSIPFTLMLYGGQYVSVPTASLVFSSMPIIILLISSLIFKEIINIYQIFGIFLYFFSLFLFLYKQWNISYMHQEFGILLIFLSLIFHAIIYIYLKKEFNHISALSFNSIPSLLSGLSLITFGWFLENPILHSFSLISIISLLYLSIFVGFLGILCYFFLQKKINTCYSSIVFIIFPMISLFLDQYLFNTKISKYEYIFIFFLLLGIIITLFSSKKYICVYKKDQKKI